MPAQPRRRSPPPDDDIPPGLRHMVSSAGRNIHAPSALDAATAAHPFANRYGLLIAEIAAQLEPLTVILDRHGVTKSEFRALRAHPTFEKALDEQVKAFASLANLPTRIKMKSQLLVEMLLDQMYDIAFHPSYAPSARVSAFSQITKLTGLERPEDAAPPRKVSLTINLGEGRVKTAETVTVEAIRDRDNVAGKSEFSFTEEGVVDDADQSYNNGGHMGDGRRLGGLSDIDDGIDVGNDEAFQEDVEGSGTGVAEGAGGLGWYDFRATQGPQPTRHISPEAAFRARSDAADQPKPVPPRPRPSQATIRQRVSALLEAQKINS